MNRVLVLSLIAGLLCSAANAGEIPQPSAKLMAARVELQQLQKKYTDAHPLVIQQKAKVRKLAQAVKAKRTPPPTSALMYPTLPPRLVH